MAATIIFLVAPSPGLQNVCALFHIDLGPGPHHYISRASRRRRREMYFGHTRLCVCVSVCPSPHSHTTARTQM